MKIPGWQTLKHFGPHDRFMRIPGKIMNFYTPFKSPEDSHGGLVVRESGRLWVQTRPKQTKFFKTGTCSSGFPLGFQDYGNSTTTGPPVLG